jgi:hypothetical protein
MQQPDSATIDHGDHVLMVNVGGGAKDTFGVLLRIFSPAGQSRFVVDAREAQELIDLLQTAMARDAEKRLADSKQEHEAMGVFPGGVVSSFNGSGR